MAQSSSAGHTFAVTLATTLALIEQFSASLTPASTSASSANRSTTNNDTQAPPSPSPLPLLSASAASLKAQCTKLSLLSITPPFTPSAISTVLTPLNESVLPSLVTAALLITPDKHTASFSAEAHSLVRNAISDLRTLLICVETRSRDGKPKREVAEGDKGAMTEAVGRVWESCDALSQLASGGVGAFVVRKAEMWLGLIKDALSELQEWDPEDEEDVDNLFNDALGNHSDEEDGDGDGSGNTPGEEGETVAKAEPKAVLDAKNSTLRVLIRVPQSVHVVIRQRLQKWKMPPEKETLPADQREIVDGTMDKLRSISETVDETAETLYMGDLSECRRLLHRVWETTVQVVEAVLEPWENREGNGIGIETKEDQYIKRSLDWIKQVEPEPADRMAVKGPSKKPEAG